MRGENQTGLGPSAAWFFVGMLLAVAESARFPFGPLTPAWPLVGLIILLYSQLWSQLLIGAFFLGLWADVLSGSPLGVHAMALLILAGAAGRKWPSYRPGPAIAGGVAILLVVGEYVVFQMLSVTLGLGLGLIVPSWTHLLIRMATTAVAAMIAGAILHQGTRTGYVGARYSRGIGGASY